MHLSVGRFTSFPGSGMNLLSCPWFTFDREPGYVWRILQHRSKFNATTIIAFASVHHRLLPCGRWLNWPSTAQTFGQCLKWAVHLIIWQPSGAYSTRTGWVQHKLGSLSRYLGAAALPRISPLWR